MDEQKKAVVRQWAATAVRRLWIYGLFIAISFFFQAQKDGWASVLVLDLSTNAALKFTAFIVAAVVVISAIDLAVAFIKQGVRDTPQGKDTP